MRRKPRKPCMTDAESDRLFMLKHQSVGLTTEQLCEAMLQTVRQMSPDEKAHFRAQLSRGLGIPPKMADGKHH